MFKYLKSGMIVGLAIVAVSAIVKKILGKNLI